MVFVPSAQVPDALTRLGNSVIPPRWIVKSQAPLSSLTGRRPAGVPRRRRAAAGRRQCSRWTTRLASIARQNFNMLLLTIFGAIALLLAAVGVYGIMSYSVEQATHDISVRLALGARGATSCRWCWAGHEARRRRPGLGTAGAFGASRLLAKMLYGVKPRDPSTYAVVAALWALSRCWRATYPPAAPCAWIPSCLKQD
jgi:hypothetical protein